MFFAQCYAPEDVSGAVLATELAVDLVKRGHQVSMITSAPSYPYGIVYKGYRNRPYQIEWIDGVKVIRTWSYISPKKTFWRQIFHYGTYCVTAIYGGLMAKKPDILVHYSPPLPLGITGYLLSRIWRVPWVMQIEDLYPEAAVAAGMLRNKMMIAFFSELALLFYKKASHISSISNIFHQKILDKGIPAQKLSVIPVWADPDAVHPMPKENRFRRQHDLCGKFVVMYAGNLGRTSSLDDVVIAAEYLRNEPEIVFVFIGEGVNKVSLQKYAAEKKLSNVIFLPFQSRDIFCEVMASADISLVTLNQNSSQFSLPSKTFNIMASGRPIIAVTPGESELAELIHCAKCGLIVSPEKPVELARAILELKNNREQADELGTNGRAALLDKYCRCGCVDAYESMLSGIMMGES
jgi:colanic acid biosynthesis glycosyl transferase WcaI